MEREISYAHSLGTRPQSEWETLEEHSLRIRTAAASRASHFGASEIAGLLGLLHDIGKLKPLFQDKLNGAANDTPHSAEGARVLSERHKFGPVLAGIIAGHHGSLPNPDQLDKRLRAAENLDLPSWCGDLSAAMPAWLSAAPRHGGGFRLQFLTRMLYSCLTEADSTETRAFYDRAGGIASPVRSETIDEAMVAAFDTFMAAKSPRRDIDQLRNRVLAHARSRASEDPGLFTLTVPTGGGKTLTSLGFALDHARTHRLRRAIFVIPYMSIAEQTADIIRAVFKEECSAGTVLEHHSSFDIDQLNDDEAELRRRGTESWDVPIVVTTAVQFFESLFAARKKRCTKLHSLAKSVIIIDEAQTMPLGFLRPCLAALDELMENYGASVVLSTATQPSLTAAGGFPAPEALEGARELAPEPDRLYSELRRVRVRDIGDQDDAALAASMCDASRALLIVDNRAQAREIFDLIGDLPGAAHLSTLMTPEHRRAVLDEVRGRLIDEQPVRLVSTSLVEAGVDVSFPLVLRSAAGIDSIAQAAGRCNRNGEMDGLGEVRVFRGEHAPPPEIEQFAKIGRIVLDSGLDPISQEAVGMYFRELWFEYGEAALDSASVGATGAAGIMQAIREAGTRIPYEDIADAFRLIEDQRRSVVIRGGRYGVSEGALGDLRFRRPGMVARDLQRFTLSVSHRHWRDLWAAGAVSWWETARFGDQFAMLQSERFYDERAGLMVAICGDSIGGIV